MKGLLHVSEYTEECCDVLKDKPLSCLPAPAGPCLHWESHWACPAAHRPACSPASMSLVSTNSQSKSHLNKLVLAQAAVSILVQSLEDPDGSLPPLLLRVALHDRLSRVSSRLLTLPTGLLIFPHLVPVEVTSCCLPALTWTEYIRLNMSTISSRSISPETNVCFWLIMLHFYLHLSRPCRTSWHRGHINFSSVQFTPCDCHHHVRSK